MATEKVYIMRKDGSLLGELNIDVGSRAKTIALLEKETEKHTYEEIRLFALDEAEELKAWTKSNGVFETVMSKSPRCVSMVHAKSCWLLSKIGVCNRQEIELSVIRLVAECITYGMMLGSRKIYRKESVQGNTAG